MTTPPTDTNEIKGIFQIPMNATFEIIQSNSLDFTNFFQQAIKDSQENVKLMAGDILEAFSRKLEEDKKDILDTTEKVLYETIKEVENLILLDTQNETRIQQLVWERLGSYTKYLKENEEKISVEINDLKSAILLLVNSYDSAPSTDINTDINPSSIIQRFLVSNDKNELIDNIGKYFVKNINNSKALIDGLKQFIKHITLDQLGQLLVKLKLLDKLALVFPPLKAVALALKYKYDEGFRALVNFGAIGTFIFLAGLVAYFWNTIVGLIPESIRIAYETYFELTPQLVEASGGVENTLLGLGEGAMTCYYGTLNPFSNNENVKEFRGDMLRFIIGKAEENNGGFGLSECLSGASADSINKRKAKDQADLEFRQKVCNYQSSKIVQTGCTLVYNEAFSGFQSAKRDVVCTLVDNKGEIIEALMHSSNAIFRGPIEEDYNTFSESGLRLCSGL